MHLFFSPHIHIELVYVYWEHNKRREPLIVNSFTMITYCLQRRGERMTRSDNSREIEIQSKTITLRKADLGGARRREAEAAREAVSAQSAFQAASKAYDAKLEAKADTKSVRRAQSTRDKARGVARRAHERHHAAYACTKECEAVLMAAQSHMARLQREQQGTDTESVLRSFGISAASARRAARATPTKRSEVVEVKTSTPKRAVAPPPTRIMRQADALRHAWGAK